MATYSITQYILAILPFLVLVWCLLIINRPDPEPEKEPEKPKPPGGSGWVYLIEKDGFLKLGSHKFFKQVNDKEYIENHGLINTLKEYSNPVNNPNSSNVNVYYYHFFENVEVWEAHILHLLQGFAIEMLPGELDTAQNNGFEVDMEQRRLINIFNDSERRIFSDYLNEDMVESIALKKTIHKLYKNTGEVKNRVGEFIDVLHKTEQEAADGDKDMVFEDEPVINDYFSKISNNSEDKWFKISDQNHNEENLNDLYTFINIFCYKGPLQQEIIEKTNKEIFETPRIFLSKLPKTK